MNRSINHKRALLTPFTADDVRLHGGLPPLPTQTLRAGPLTLLYEAGGLRSLTCDGVEVLRGIYAAVRDPDWLTVPGQIKNERIETGEDHFTIRYSCRYAQGDLVFRAHFAISGSATGQITFTMSGQALRRFRKNRIGFCVLHPTEGLAGTPCEIAHPDGRKETLPFPQTIAPHQPFTDLRAMRWQPLPDWNAHLQFSGDVFETEDQRNWTDASYKTYCTPLARPFPAEVAEGQRFVQGITLDMIPHLPGAEAEGRNRHFAHVSPSHFVEDADVLCAPTRQPTRPLPPIGLSRASDFTAAPETLYTPEEIAALRALNLSHLRVEVRMDEGDCASQLGPSLREAALLQVPVACAVWFGKETEAEAQAERLVALLQQSAAPIVSVLVLSSRHKTTPDALFAAVAPVLRRELPNRQLGAGTDAYFAELNRARPDPATDCDFLAYSVNPQVHADDTCTLFENLPAQADTVHSARAFAGDKRLHVGPVTLKRRRNPDATGPQAPEPTEALPWNVDVRQASLLGAAWTLGSLKTLTEAGADTLTYGETAGMRGLFLPAGADIPHGFPAQPGAWFPVYHALRAVTEFRPCDVVPWRSACPALLEVLALRRALTDGPARLRLLFANLTSMPQTVRIAALGEEADWQVLDMNGLRNASTPGNAFRPDAIETKISPRTHWRLSLAPYAVGMLNVRVDIQDTLDAMNTSDAAKESDR